MEENRRCFGAAKQYLCVLHTTEQEHLTPRINCSQHSMEKTTPSCEPAENQAEILPQGQVQKRQTPSSYQVHPSLFQRLSPACSVSHGCPGARPAARPGGASPAHTWAEAGSAPGAGRASPGQGSARPAASLKIPANVSTAAGLGWERLERDGKGRGQVWFAI